MKIIAISFGNGRWNGALTRLQKQMLETGLFEDVITVNEHNIDEFCPEWHIENLDMIKRHNFWGYGEWIWKPYLIERIFEYHNDADYFVYIDSGTEININFNDKTQKRFQDYIEEANKNNIFAFRNRDLETKFTHCETIDAIYPKARETLGFHAGFLILKNNKESLDFIKEWKYWGTTDNYKYLLQHYNPVKCCDDYLRCIGDQSILGCLLKLHGIEGFKDEGDWYHEGYSILEELDDNRDNYPIFFARNFQEVSVFGKCVQYNRQIKHVKSCEKHGISEQCNNLFIAKIDDWHK
jgi:hypothetical protein